MSENDKIMLFQNQDTLSPILSDPSIVSLVICWRLWKEPIC